MTIVTAPSAIFTGSPKLFVFGAGECLLKDLRDLLPYAVIPVRQRDDGTTVATTAEAEVEVIDPPAGLSVIARTESADAQAKALQGLWQAAGLGAPPILTLPESAGDADVSPALIAISNAFGTAALAAHKDACSEAVLLDRQIAALREQLEDSRNKWQDCAAALKTVTRSLPVLGFATRDFSGRMKMTRATVLSQQLPYAGVYCKAAAIHLGAPATAEGRLECRLIAQEDDVELARWERLAANRTGWQTLELPADIPWRYRNLRLVLIWHGPDAAGPEFSLARAAGMDRHFLHVNGAPQDGARLALRAWTGHPDTPPPAAGTPPSALYPDRQQGLGQPVGTEMLEHHVKLVDRRLGEWPWVTIRNNAVMVHPTLEGPSVIGVTVADAIGLCGVQLTCDSPNQAAPPIEFSVAAYRGTQQLTLDDADPDPLPRDTALAREDWQELPAGSSMPLTLSFTPRDEPVQLVLATRVRGGSVENAHGWFRDIRLVFAT